MVPLGIQLDVCFLLYISRMRVDSALNGVHKHLQY